jgi:Family of unknown function (DUF5694)
MKTKLLLLLAFMATTTLLLAQQKPTQVVLLGCFHFDNPGLDVAKFENANILSEKRQAEVKEVLAKLEAYKPDKIFLEVPVSAQGRLDSSYTQYLNKQKQLTASETHQLGFKLAAALGHTRLYAIDDRSTSFPFDSLMKVMTANKQFDMLEFVKKTIDSLQTDFNSRLQMQTIGQLLLAGNNAESRRNGVGWYFELLRAGDLNNQVGAYMVSEWWRRNMMIYGNMQKLLTGKEERILVIFGSAHTALIEEMMQYNNKFEIVPVSRVL